MRRRTHRQRGFALLLIFAMAAAMAVLLYREMPRVLFEGQREKEQLLIARGEQYKRAVQLFVRKNQKYPSSLDDLERYQDIRFLRRRYKDPMTGKDEWRIIHFENGAFPDSLVYKQPDPADQKQPRDVFVAEIPTVGSQNTAAGTGAVNMGLQRRASDRPAAAAGVDSDGVALPPGSDPNSPPPPGGYPSDPNQQQTQTYPQQQPGYPSQQQQGLPPYPGQGQPGQQVGFQPGQQVGFQPGQQPYPQGQPIPYQPGQLPYQQSQPGGVPFSPGQPGQAGGGVIRFPIVPGQQNPFQQQQQQQPGGQNSNTFIGGGSQSFIGGSTGTNPQQPQQQYYPPNVNPGQNPYQQPQAFPAFPRPPISSQAGGASPVPIPGMGAPVTAGRQPSTAGSSNQAIDMIRQILTTPRPGGMPGATGTTGQASLGAGVAGVATNVDAEGILVYAERTNYKEWEFIYDASQDRSRQMAGQGGQQGQGGLPGGLPGGAPGRQGQQGPQGFSPQMPGRSGPGGFSQPGQSPSFGGQGGGARGGQQTGSPFIGGPPPPPPKR